MASEVSKEVAKANEQLMSKALEQINFVKGNVRYKLEAGDSPEKVRTELFEHVNKLVEASVRLDKYKSANNVEEVLEASRNAIDDLIREVSAEPKPPSQ